MIGENAPASAVIEDQLREDIESGRLSPGEKMLSVREMAKKLMVSNGTVQVAFDALTRAGLIHSEKGRGTYVNAKRLPEDLESIKLRAIDAGGQILADFHALESMLRDKPQPKVYPYIEGEFLYIGPECFTYRDDHSVICFRAKNYVPQVTPSMPQHHDENGELLTYSFAEALPLLKRSHIMARRKWLNSKDTNWVAMQTPRKESDMTNAYLFMSDRDGEFFPYTLTNDDLFARDWYDTGALIA